MGNKFKKFIFAVALLFALPISCVSASASEINSSGQTSGSIAIHLEETKSKDSRKGVQFTVVKVADLIGGSLVLKGDFLECDVDLNTIRYSRELEQAAQKLQSVCTEKILNNAETVYIKTDSDGSAYTELMGKGAYLIYVSDQAEYEKISSCIVSIPTWNETDGTMQYDLTIYPKHTPNPIVPTGDSVNIKLYVTICIVAFCMMIAVHPRKKKVK